VAVRRARRSTGAARALPFGAVLLDVDGTLIDSNDAHARAWVDSFRAFGRRVAVGKVRFQIGKGGGELVREFVTPLERHLFADAMGSTETQLFLARFRKIRVFAGAAETVRAMSRAGVRIVLASSAERSVVERSVKLLRIGRHIAGYTSADDVKKAKPFHDVFSVAIARFRLAALRPVAIGDTPYDIAAAHQIGLPCLAVRCGGFPEKTLAGADRMYDDLESLWRDERLTA
jgi:beta-phosphoglucomutase-like phosphatase (HAD superfamily)